MKSLPLLLLLAGCAVAPPEATEEVKALYLVARHLDFIGWVLLLILLFKD